MLRKLAGCNGNCPPENDTETTKGRNGNWLRGVTETASGRNRNYLPKRETTATGRIRVPRTTNKTATETKKRCNRNHGKLKPKPTKTGYGKAHQKGTALFLPGMQRPFCKYFWSASPCGTQEGLVLPGPVGRGLRVQGKPQNPQPLQPVARISAEQADWNFFKLSPKTLNPRP